MTTAHIDEQILREIEADLVRMQQIDRSPALANGMRRSGNIVKRRTYDKLPRPGYAGDKEGETPLRDTLGTKVVHYESGKMVVLTGYRRDKGGQHGHLAEKGHVMTPHRSTSAARRVVGSKSNRKGRQDYNSVGMGGTVEGRHDLENASKETLSAQFAAISRGVLAAVKRKVG